MKTIAYLMTAMILSACGGSVMEEGQEGEAGTGGGAGTGGTGGSGGATGGTGGATGGTGGATGGTGGSTPDACAVETNLPGPYQVAFSFVSKNVQPVYVLEECRLQYHVKSCADDYQAALAITADCTVDCSDPAGGCIACGACMSVMVPVSASTSTQASWLGNTYTFGTNSEGCSCHNTFEAPAGKYRIEVPVYLDPKPYASAPIHTAVVDFTLPAPNGTVTVDLTGAYPED